jgi:predicted RNA-binding Zn ribbon-like protein
MILRIKQLAQSGQREVQSELSQLRTKLEQFEQEQVQLRSQVSSVAKPIRNVQSRTYITSISIKAISTEDIDQYRRCLTSALRSWKKTTSLGGKISQGTFGRAC